MMDDLVRLAETASDSLLEAAASSKYVRVVSHSDPDGITAAAILSTALFRLDVPFHITLVSRFEESVLDVIRSSAADLVVLCDMGSGQPELVGRIDEEVIVLDHHRPVGEHRCIHVNPHLVGLDGSFELSASGVAYFVARAMGENVDLSSLAILGALGDKQSMRGANGFILEEASLSGAVERDHGLMLPDGELESVLFRSLDPYFEFSGDSEMVDEFLSQLNLSGRISALDYGSLRRLASALALMLLRRGAVEAIDSLIGEKYRFAHEVIPDAIELLSIVKACGMLEEPGLALSLCLRDDSVLEDARTLEEKGRERVLDTLKMARRAVSERENLRYVILSDVKGTGVIADTMVRYVFPEKPFLVLNQTPEIVKVSARGTRRQVSEGLDLAIALRDAATLLGGVGGGHNIASGASIPPGTEEEMIELVNEAIGRQLRGRE
ncbi:DHHA1 domain protein [Candidatus Methanoperedenaceae archaeon GB50]|nr:DHHA1 domain protein [Candidatus Methanoperedenaceae archaeon GB50]